MIKTNIVKTEKPISKYPYVGKYDEDDTVILFTRSGTGIVIHSDDVEYKVGYMSHNMTESRFIPTCVTLDSTV